MRDARGVLRVVEVYGAALLAEEMEHTSRWLAGNDTDARQFVDGLDALMRSSVQLPTYLERVLSGGRDLALVLLPLLNDLRAVRGAPLLSEGTLLSLNLSSEKSPAERAPLPGDQKLTVPQWARRLRTKYQAGLLALIRGEGERPRPGHARRGREPHGGRRDDRRRVPVVVGDRRAARCAARRRAAAERHGQAPARPRRPRAEAALCAGRGSLRRGAADRAAEQPAVLRRARRDARRAHRRGARLLPPRRAAADRRVGRAGARIAVRAVGAPDAHGRRGDQGGPGPGQGRARPLHAQGRAAGGTGAAGRPAEEDRRHAGRARPGLGARAGAARARRGSATSSRAACRPSRTR